jgi:cytosine/adenosine deaminase-related metal-dependent hydrolase
MVGLHASMTLSDQSLKKIVEMFGEQGVGYHFHLAEDQSDQYDAITKYGKRVSQRLDEFGIINAKSLAVHGVHLNETEIEILSGKNMNLALCPRSNQNNAVGFPAWWDYKNIKIGLGTDGIGSDILSEARAALYLSRLLRHDPDFGFEQTKKMLLENNPLICEIITGAKVGRIAPGYRADLVFWRYNAPTPLKSENIWGHYLYGLSCQTADSVWSCGRPILRHGQFTDFDYDEILTRARKLAESLWERI